MPIYNYLQRGRDSGQETEEMGFLEEPMYLRQLSSHWRGPFRDISTQHGVLVTS